MRLAVGAPPARAEDLNAQWQSLKTHYAGDIRQLAEWCDQHQLSAEAKKTRAVRGPNDPYKLYLPVLPKEVGPAKVPADTAADVLEWQGKLGKLRHDQAAAPYDLARRAVRQHEPSLAYILVLEAIRENPDHEGARRVLGYQKYRNQWHTPYEVRKLRGGLVWSDKFGWLSKGALDHYQRGQRPAGPAGSRPPKTPAPITISKPPGKSRRSTTRSAAITASRRPWAWARSWKPCAASGSRCSSVITPRKRTSTRSSTAAVR